MSVSLDMLPDDELERLYNAGLVPDEEIERIALARISPRDLAIIDGIAYGIAKLLNTPINQLAAEASSYRATRELPPVYDPTFMPPPRGGHVRVPGPGASIFNKVTQDVARGNLREPYGMTPPWSFPAAEEHEHMSANPYVGADGQSYPEVASHAVRNLQQQSPSPVYGYLRTGSQQKIYLYPSLDVARGWFAALAQAQAQPYDYAAVFVATDLSRPVPGLESFGHTFVSGAYVGAASEADLIRHATDTQFFAMYPERHGRKIDPSNPADRALIPIWNDLHQQTAARAQSLALAGDTQVGQFLPFLLGLPLGGLAGYFLRRWQEQHPGHTIPGIPPGKLPAPIIPPLPPKTSGDWLGGPWHDIEQSYVGGPWLDIDPMFHAYVGQAAAEHIARAAHPVNFMDRPDWGRHRAYAQSLANSILENDQIFDQVARQILQLVGGDAHLLSQPNWPQTRMRIRGGIRRVIDTDQLIDQIARPIIKYLMESRPGSAAPPPSAVQGDYVGGPWLDIDIVGQDVSSEEIESLARELSNTFGVPFERTQAELMEIARDMNVSVGGPWLDIEPMVGGPWYDIEPMVGGPWYDIESAAIGGPWLDIEEPAYTIGGPWLDVVGANDDRARMRAWPQTKALIQSAINEVSASANQAPAEAYVWSLDPPNPHLEGAYAASDPYRRPLPPQGMTNVVPFSSPAQALDYMRERIQTPHVALALFDRRSSHWPNPTNWTKSNAPEHEPIIAQQIARSASPRTAGDYGDASFRRTSVGAALDDVRARAQTIANKRAGSVVGVIHTTKDGLWHALAFRNADDADDWLGTATQDPAAYTYAAYYDKQDFSWPHPVNEKIGGERTVAQPGQPIRRAPATASGMR
jgi:hypothetical protein